MRIALVSIKWIKHKVTKQLRWVMSLTITDAEADSLTYLKLFWWTEQKSKNLINPALWWRIDVDWEWTMRQWWIIDVPAWTYTVSLQDGACFSNMLVNGVYWTAQRVQPETPRTFTLNSAWSILVYGGSWVSIDTVISRQPQLEEGSEATAYQPYAWTPTPDSPVDITSNNGAIKWGVTSKNLLDMSSDNIVLEKFISNSWVITADNRNFYNSKYIPVKASAIYTWSTSGSIAYCSIIEYDSNKTFVRRTLFGSTSTAAWTSWNLTTTANTAYILFGSNLDNSTITLTKINAINRQIEEWNTATEYVPYTEWIYCAWPIETVEDSLWNTATAEMLLKVWNYQDEQDVISGSVIRKVGIKVLDWTENWSIAGSWASSYFMWVVTGEKPDVNGYYDELSTHFPFAYITSTNVEEGIAIRVSGEQVRVSIRYTDLYPAVSTNIAALKQRLADQYAAWTPVIVVYPLATETTESVTPQTMNVRSGNNTIEITQAGLDDLELEIEYNWDS